MSALHDLGADGNQAAKTQCVSTPVAVYHCPSRRAAIAYPVNPTNMTNCLYRNLVAQPTVCGRSDYAGAGGEYPTSSSSGYPADVPGGDAMTASQWAGVWGGADSHGIFYVRSKTTMASITDAPATPSSWRAKEHHAGPLLRWMGLW